MQTRIREWGVNLITVNRKTGKFEECEAVIQTNTTQGVSNINDDDSASQIIPQLDLKVTKNDPKLQVKDIEFDIGLTIGSILFKYKEDLVIRVKAITRLKVDKKLKESAYDKMEDLKETTKSRLHAIIYRRANRYKIYMQSPVFVLPIRGTFHGNNSPIWVIRTGDVSISSADED